MNWKNVLGVKKTKHDQLQAYEFVLLTSAKN
jgi:hypothetical protein